MNVFLVKIAMVNTLLQEKAGKEFTIKYKSLMIVEMLGGLISKKHIRKVRFLPFLSMRLILRKIQAEILAILLFQVTNPQFTKKELCE